MLRFRLRIVDRALVGYAIDKDLRFVIVIKQVADEAHRFGMLSLKPVACVPANSAVLKSDRPHIGFDQEPPQAIVRQKSLIDCDVAIICVEP